MKLPGRAAFFLALPLMLVRAYPQDMAWFAASHPTLPLPRVEEDRAGALRALWVEDGAAGSAIVLGRVVGDAVTAEDIVASVPGQALSPDFDFDPLNRPWVAWIDPAGGSSRISVREPDTGRTWRLGTASLVSASRVKILAGGPAGPWIVWTGRESGRDETFASRFDGAAWSAPSRLQADNTAPSILMDAAADASGRPWVVWSRDDGKDYEVFVSRWDGSTWSAEEALTDDAGSDAWPGIVFMGGSLPVVVWAHAPGPSSSLRARLFEAGAWGPPLELTAEGEGIFEPRVSIRGGRLVIAWRSGGTIRSLSLARDELEARPFPAARTDVPAFDAAGRDENSYTAFGDEITYGWIDGAPAPDLGYVPRLQDLLTARFGPSVAVNEGVPGETTINGLGRMSDVLARDAGRYLLLMEGTNDIVLPDLSIDAVTYNLEQMVLKCVGAGVLPVMATIIPRNDAFWNDPFFRERIDDLNAQISRIALNLNLPFLDMFTTFLDYPEADGGFAALLSDPAHPNERGYEIMAGAWAEAIGRIPFPPSPVTVLRSTERALLADRKVNFLTWRHSSKIRNPFLFRSYKIFKKDAGEPEAGFRLIAVVAFSPFHDPQKYNDLDILETHRYVYAVSLVAIDGIEGPLSEPATESEL